MREAGKGSKPRPLSVNQETFNNEYDRIFGKKDAPVSEPLPDDIQHRLDNIADRLEQLHTEILNGHDTNTGEAERDN